jgi:hypothetical protein
MPAISVTPSKITVNGINIFFMSTIIILKIFILLTANGLQLPEGGDFGALHCQPSTNFDRSTKLDLTT